MSRDACPCDIDELRTLFLFEKLDDEQLEWLCEHGHIEWFEPGWIAREGEPATLLLRPARGLDRAVAPGRRRRRRDQPHRAARRLRRRVVGLSRRPRRRRPTRARPARSTRVPHVRARRATTSPTLMRNWFPMPLHLLEGLFFGQQNNQRRRRAARAAARPRFAVGRAHPRAEQPGRRGGARDVLAARAGRGHAAEAELIAGGAWDRSQLETLIEAAGARGRAGRQGAGAQPARGVRPRGRADRLVRRPRHRRAATTSRRPSSRPGSTSAGSTRSPRTSTTTCSRAPCAG